MINYIKKICVLHVSSNGIFIHSVFPLLVILFITKLHASGGADGGSGVRFLYLGRAPTNCHDFFLVNQTKHKNFWKFIITRVILLLKKIFYFKNTLFYFNTFTLHFACTSFYISWCTVSQSYWFYIRIVSLHG